MRGFSFFLMAVCICVLSFKDAQAGYVVWEDPSHNVGMKVPDTWLRVPANFSDEIVRFRAPGQNQHASCELRVNNNHRFDVYPVAYAPYVRDFTLDDRFWERVSLERFKQYYIHHVDMSTGLGEGQGSLTDVSFVPLDLNIDKRALMLASVYAGKLYVFSCSAEAQAFPLFHENFRFVLSSFRMRKDVHELPSGHYRDFTQDKILRVHTIPDRMTSDH